MNTNSKTDQFWRVARKPFQTSLGVINLPILYPDFSYAFFLFWVDWEKAAAKLAPTVFAPCRFINARAGVLLNIFQYRQSDIGSYNEVGLSILCHPRDQKNPNFIIPQLFMNTDRWTMGAYVVDLPVTTEIAYVGGREVWSYPKFVTNIVADLKDRRFRGVVDDPELKQPLFTLEGEIGPLGPGIRFSTASFISYTTHKGTPLRVLTEVDTKFKINLGFSGTVQVNQNSKHIMAKNLLDLDLQDKRPFVTMYSEKARMKLHEGTALR
jgi:hypothetical protein